MKKSVLLTSLLFVSGSVFSQNLLSVSNLSVERKGKQVEVSFDATNTAKPFNISNTYTFTPVIAKGNRRYAMPPIMFGSRRAKILNQRRGVSIDQFHHKGETVHYRLHVPYSEWMSDGALAMETAVDGCCCTQTMRPYFLASTILPKPAIAPIVAPVEIASVPAKVASTGKQMADKHSFITPISQWLDVNGKPVLDLSLLLTMGKAKSNTDQRMIENYLAQNEEGALMIYFPVGVYKVEPTFANNDESIKKLIETVASILGSSDSSVSHVVIAGFASPEGMLDLNDRLAWNRAQSLKQFLSQSTGVDDHKIYLYNGRENWMGLRKLVADSRMDYREEVLGIIDNVSVTRGREAKLMELAGGRPYNYMLKHFFPQLRHAAYIKVYYEDKR